MGSGRPCTRLITTSTAITAQAKARFCRTIRRERRARRTAYGSWLSWSPTSTDAALEVADLVLVRDQLSQLPYAIRLARRSRRIVRQNLAFACAVIAVLVVINLVHGLPLPIGVIGHEGSTILVVLNGLRLLRPLRNNSS